MGPRRTFWLALLMYGLLSIATFAPTASASQPGSVAGTVGSAVLVAGAGYALVEPERAGGPEGWNLVVVAAVTGAALFALGVLVGAV